MYETKVSGSDDVRHRTAESSAWSHRGRRTVGRGILRTIQQTKVKGNPTSVSVIHPFYFLHRPNLAARSFLSRLLPLSSRESSPGKDSYCHPDLSAAESHSASAVGSSSRWRKRPPVSKTPASETSVADLNTPRVAELDSLTRFLDRTGLARWMTESHGLHGQITALHYEGQFVSNSLHGFV
ncbi:unnamed protein product [Protopolystoma xenopodis]|uniref:Uncharacterized protein n=1 Tax=Protopolystoma xenopodis TaxID=117903 RepID=A0A3S5BRF1_9PLAT|nr:unnamed protein product [Protopolystoma xenopodis]